MNNKTLGVLLAVLMLPACFAGCSSPASTATTPASSTGTASTQAASTAPSSTTAQNGAFSYEGLSGKLVIYSANDSKVTEDTANLFTQKTGVTCEILYGGGGELMARIAAEGANALGDVVDGVTAEVLIPYVQYLEPYHVVSTDPSLLANEAGPDGIYAPGGSNVMVFMVNKNLLSKEDYPASWADLTDEKYRGQIAFADPSASSSAYLQLNVMQQLYGWDFVKEFYANLDEKILSGSSAAPKGTADGEYMIALTIENSAADYLDANAPIDVIYPEDGTMKTIGGAAIIKGCKNPDNAKAYIELTCSKEVSEICAKYNRRGARADVPLSDILPKLSDIKFMNYDYEAASDREAILSAWNDILIGK